MGGAGGDRRAARGRAARSAARAVVAVGDADNDLPMLEAAGLGVAMGNATAAAKRVASRVIGSNDGDALGALVEELFLDGVSASR